MLELPEDDESDDEEPDDEPSEEPEDDEEPDEVVEVEPDELEPLAAGTLAVEPERLSVR